MLSLYFAKHECVEESPASAIGLATLVYKEYSDLSIYIQWSH